MKNYSLKALAIAATATIAPLLSHAQIVLTNNDALNTSSFNAKQNWNSDTAPVAGKTYSTGIYGMRTPATAANYTFGGDSLTLTTPNNANNYSFAFKVNGSSTLTANWILEGGVAMHNNSSTQVGTFAGTMAVNAAGGVFDPKQGPFVISANLTGNGPLTVAASQNNTYSTVTFTGTNTAFTGKLILNNSANANPFVQFNGPFTMPGNPAVSTADQIAFKNTLIDLYGVTYSNPNGGITLSGNATINASGTNGATVIGSPIAGDFSLVKRGSGALTLSAANTFTGGLALYGISAGSQLNINHPSALGTGSFEISNGNNAAIDNTSGAPITLTTGNNQNWRNSFTFVGSGTLDMGGGAATIYGNTTVTVSNSVLSVGPLNEDGFARTFTKAGAGKLVFKGGVTTYGDLLVNGGILAVTDWAGFQNPSIIVASNATLDVSTVPGGMSLAYNQVLGGGGTVAATVNDGYLSVIEPGGKTNAGTLTVSGLNLANGGTVRFDLSNDPSGTANDTLVVTGSLSVTAPTSIELLGVPAPGAYTLFRYGTFSGDVANFQAPVGYQIVNNVAAKTIELAVTHVPAALTWVGDSASNIWDTGTNANWAPTPLFFAGDRVTFDDSGSASPPVTLMGIVSPGSTTVNASKDYTFTGAPIVSGSLVKSGTGTLIIDNDNTYSGGTLISGGAIQLGTGLTTGRLGAGAVTNNGSLVLNHSDNLILANVITGTGSVNVIGGSATLNGSNSYAGLTTIANGTVLQINNTNSLGATNGGTVVQEGGQLFMSAHVNFDNEPLTLSGNGVGDSGALRKNGNGVTTFGGPITLASSARIKLDGGSTLNLTNAAGINGAAANATLSLAGDGGSAGNISNSIMLGTGGLTVIGGTWTVAPTNYYSGPTLLTGGLLRSSQVEAFGAEPATWNPAWVTLRGGGLEASTNMSLTDGKRGIFADYFNDGVTIISGGVLAVDPGATLTIANPITGAGSVTKWLAGTLVLTGTNTFSGNYYLDGGSTTANDGVTRITTARAFGGVPVDANNATIIQRNNNSGSSTLQLDGATGSIALAQRMSFNCRNVAVPHVQNLAGNNTLSGRIDLYQGGSFVYFQSDAGLLTLSGEQQYIGGLTGGRTYTFSGAGDVLVSGAILNSTNGAPIALAKNGTGTLTLAGANTYGSVTTVNEGLLMVTGSITSTGAVNVVSGTLNGNGTISAAINIGAAGILSPGAGAGKLTVNGDLTLAGQTLVEINKGGVSDSIEVSGAVAFGGILVVTNNSGTLTPGDSFTLVNPGSRTGNFSAIVNATGNSGIDFTFDPAKGVLSVIASTAAPSISLTTSTSGLSLNWGTTGWLVQTNSADLANPSDWKDVPGSDTMTSLNITPDLAQPKVFFRLRK